MNKLFSLIAGAAVLGAGLLAATPAAMARDNIDWSVSIGSGGYGYPAPVVVQPPVVVHAPPPVVVHRPVAVVGYGPSYYYAPPRHAYGPGWRHHHRGHHHRHHHRGHHGGHHGHR